MIRYYPIFQREPSCWALALFLHALLFLWRGGMLELPNQELDPIINVNMIVQQFEPQLGQQQASRPSEASKGIFGRIKRLLSREKVTQPEASAQKLAGNMDKKIKNQARSDTQQQLVDKQRKTSGRAFDMAQVSKSRDEQLSMTDKQNIETSISRKMDTNKKPDLKDKGQNRVAKRDLPFQIASARGGDLSMGSDAPTVSVSGQTGKNVKRVTKSYTRPATSASLKDKGSYGGSSNLSGVGGGGAIQGAGSKSTQKGLSGTKYAANPLQDRSGEGGGGSGYRSFGGSGYTPSGQAGSQAGDVSGLSAGGGGRTGKTKRHASGLYELKGPLSNRDILRQVIPPYPDWAKKKGIFASVSLYFFVLHSGIVKDNVVIQTTSGYPKLDKLSIDSLMKWRFAPLPRKDYGKEQWGIITFRFKLR